MDFGRNSPPPANGCGCARTTVDGDPAAAARLADPARGWAYVDQARFCPKLHDLISLRTRMVKRLELGGRRLLLCRAEGDYFCVDEMCSHEDYSLWFGCIKGRAIKCSLHGSLFDLASGAPLNEPANQPLKTCPVKVGEGRVWVEIPA